MKNVDDQIRTLADTSFQICSPKPYHCASNCSCRTTAKLCNLCEEHVNIINTAADPDPNPMIGGQLPNPNECHSTLTSAISPYIYIYSLGFEYDFLTAPFWWVLSKNHTRFEGLYIDRGIFPC